MTSIVTTPKPRYQRRKKAAKAAPIECLIITAAKPSKRVRSSDDADVDVPESANEFVKRMMQPP
jgi:hypothetical protein